MSSNVQSVKENFNNLYNKAILNQNPLEVQDIILNMYTLLDTLKTLPNPQSEGILKGLWNWFSPNPTSENLILEADFTNKLGLVWNRFYTLKPSLPPFMPPHNVALGSFQQVHLSQHDYAVGFSNLSNNCWANALLSWIVFIPSLKHIYATIGEYYAQSFNAQERQYGLLLLQILVDYQNAFTKKEAVPSHASQNLREVFHALFGQMHPILQTEIFSASCHAQEDANEALQMLFGKYKEILKERNPTGMDMHLIASSPLFFGIEAKRCYRPIGEQRAPDSFKLSKGDYSYLGEDNVSSKTYADCQILLDMQNKNYSTLSDLLKSYFKDLDVGQYDSADYLLWNGQVQSFQLSSIECQFQKPPQELILLLKRFGNHIDGSTFKIIDLLKVERSLCLGLESNQEGKKISYELDTFIVHAGGIQGGHYICYKKVNDQWLEINDSSVRFVPLDEIDYILSGKKESHTSYLHHYVRASAQEENALLPALENPIYSQELIEIDSAIQNLLIFSKHPDAKALNALPAQFLGVLQHAIWLHDNTPDLCNYGDQVLKENPLKPFEVQIPWLIGCQGINLCDQLQIILKKKQEILVDLQKEKLLCTFLEKLHQPCSNEELLRFYQQLPEKVRWKLQELIYKSHKIKFGEEYVHDPKYKNNYGAYALEGGDLRKTLLEATEPVLNSSQKNIVEQLALELGRSAEKMRRSYEKEQLQAFRELYTQDLSKNQLVKTFERLELREELKGKIYEAIWVGYGSTGPFNFGSNKFAEDPHCLIAIKTPIFSLSPLSELDVLEQIIFILSEGSIEVDLLELLVRALK